MHIFFDLDDTLWDFARNTSDTIAEMFLAFEFENRFPHITLQTLQNAFPVVNERLWEDLFKKLIEADILRNTRFKEVLKYIGYDISLDFSKELSTYYMTYSPKKPHLVEGARELLETLTQKEHKIHIITNGFEHIQHQKIQSSNIGHFLTHIITSEQTQVKKPDAKMYHCACQLVGELPQNCMMVGDHWENDVIGAKNVGMKTLFFNPLKKKISPENLLISPQIFKLSQILDFL